MHPRTLTLYETAKRQYAEFGEKSGVRKLWLQLIESARHFHISQGIFDVADHIMWETFRRGTRADEGTMQAVLPIGARLPADPVVLTIGHNVCGSCLLYKEKTIDDGWACVLGFVKGGFMGFTPLGVTVPGGGFHDFLPEGLWAEEKAVRAQLSYEQKICTLFKIAVCISLINEPRRVLTKPATGLDWTKQHRKSVERATGRAALAYSTVSWELGAAVRQRVTTGDDNTLKHPLHWCRGHWRKSAAGVENAQWITPSQGAPAGWYIWVRDYWKGHPSLGIKLQTHTPRCVGEKPAAPVQKFATLGTEKLAVMSAQQRALLVQSGFAPSATVH